MAKTTTHSKLKLALGVLTSPGAAFEEITRRKLLGTGLLIAGLAGVMATISAVERAIVGGPLQLFALGRYNPVAWLGLFLLYGFALHKLLKWLGTDNDYRTILTLMGWAQVPLLVAHFVTAMGSGIAIVAKPGPTVMQFTTSLDAVLQLAYVAVLAVGIGTVYGAPTSRGLLGYLVVEFAALISFHTTYASSRLRLFSDALPSVSRAAEQISQVDVVPWVAASAVGLAAGLWHLGKQLGWDRGLTMRAAAGGAVIGAAIFGAYLYAFTTADYYGRLHVIQSYYDTDRYARAAEHLRALSPLARNNELLRLEMNQDLGRIYYLLEKPDTALRYYNSAISLIKRADVGKDEPYALAQPCNGIGAVRDQQGKYDEAITYFERAAKGWPQFREPWARMAVTYDRMGRYDKAIESGEHAVKKLGSKAAVAYAALVQAYTRTGDTKKARDAYQKLTDYNEDLAKKIGEDPAGWQNAVAKLTVQDLQWPLERQVAATPEKAAKR